MSVIDKIRATALCEANQEIERLKAIIAEREWQPIETAPDFGRILVYHPPVLATRRYRGLPSLIRVDDNTGIAIRGRSEAYWQPLPKPPETGK
jgi:hypothetical protein